MTRGKPLLLLFDANALIHRAFHAMKDRPLTVSKTGERVEAVYGFALTLFKVLQEFHPAYCAAAFDLPAPTFRHIKFADYKKGRPGTPDDLVPQFRRVRELVQALNIPVFEAEGYEADDVLGTLAQQASSQDMETIIITGDADALQLISPVVRVLMPQWNLRETILYDEASVQRRYGINPEQVPDLKALMGDPSDKIPGIPGIGEKTAMKLLQQFGSVEQIYHSLDQIASPRVRESLNEKREAAQQSKEIATIVTHVPLEFNPEACEVSKYDRGRLLELLRELEFFSLLGRLPETKSQQEDSPSRLVSPSEEGDYHIVDTPQSLDGLLSETFASFAFTLFTTPGEADHPHIVGIALSPRASKAYYLPIGHRGLEQGRQLDGHHVLTCLRPLLENPQIAKIAHDGKGDIAVLANYQIQLVNFSFDTAIAAYLLGDKSLELPALALAKLGLEVPFPLPGQRTKHLSLSEMSIPQVAGYACAYVDAVHRLRLQLEKELVAQGLGKLFTEVEMPLVPVLVSMERSGIALDVESLRQMSLSLGEQLLNLAQEIYRSVGHGFNINSPQQLSAILFEELKLPPARKTKSGYSTEASVLEGLKEAHPVVEFLIEYRQLSKLKSTYIDALPALINPRTGRVHTIFNQTVVTTGRLSSRDPNLQNIPVRGEMGKQMRKAFKAEPPCLLLGADYSQIDLRVLAHLSQDPLLLESFQMNEDIHSATASRLFGVTPKEITTDMRRVAKTVNFGVIYGMSAYGLEQATELSPEEAARFIASYFEKHPGVKEYLETTKEQARKSGYVQTLLGRRRYIPEINSANLQIRAAAERTAINMPVQGTSADIIKIAMVNIHQKIERQRLRSKMILQVHDELLFEVLPEELEEMKRVTEETMPRAVELSVPLKIEVKMGSNWGEMK